MNENDQLALRSAIKDKDKRQLLQEMLSEMLITVEDEYFKDGDFWIDGYRFINCRFENCTLRISRGTFEFHRCIEQKSRRIWCGDAMKCIQFYTRSHPDWEASPAFGAKKYENGAFTIARGVSFEKAE